MDEPLPYDEEFLYHLSRGSEFLIANRVGEAKEELERALVFQPRDAKGQDLLAGVYFRLGVYPRAIELWSALVEQHPDDVPLRVNLGLALLKTAQLEDAVMHLTRATTLDETHARAWGYLGLALWREGRLDRAREAFSRGGQASMARRMEEMLGVSLVGHPAPSLSVLPPPPTDGEDAPALSMPWVVSEGRMDVPIEPPRATRPSSLRASLEQWAPRVSDSVSLASDGPTLAVTPHAGEVVVMREHALAVRGGTNARTGLVTLAPGQQALLAAPEGQQIYVLHLEEQDRLYVVERYLLAYDVAGGGETRAIEVGGVSMRVAALRGRASVAVACARRPVALPTRGEQVLASAARIVGWAGNLFPSQSSTSGLLSLGGEGTLLLA